MSERSPYPKTSTAKKKIRTVMREFYAGKLRSSSGKKVPEDRPDIAKAIALSEARAKGAEQRTWKGRRRLRPKLKPKGAVEMREEKRR